MRIFPRRRVDISLMAILKTYLRHLLNGRKYQPLIAQLETQFAQYIGVQHAIALPTARVGLAALLDHLNYAKDDQVILSAYNYHIIPAVFKNRGLQPVFVDIHPDTYTIDERLIEAKITKRTKFLVATHLFGQSCQMAKIVDICQKHDVFLIEDVAHACGREYHSDKLGSFGDASFFSFGTGKAMVALGGGMMTTKDEQLANEMRAALKKRTWQPSEKVALKLRQYAQPLAETVFAKKVIFPVIVYPILRLLKLLRFNLGDYLIEDKYVLKEGLMPKKVHPFSAFQADLVLQQLATLDASNRQRMALGATLSQLLDDVTQVQGPLFSSEAQISLYYAIAAQQMSALREFLFLRGVDTKRGNMRDCTGLDFLESKETCPIAAALSPKVLELPCYPSLSLEDMYYQANVIRTFYGYKPVLKK
jgi:dTDP-4-amino-4,6-dideoxygalactose transaminase